jgi:gas vesicle protein GvpL/GvpF
VIHVYAFADEVCSLPHVEGLDGAPLELRTIDGLAAVISRRRGGEDTGSLRDEALVHGLVVEALAERAGAVLPVRFGETSADDEALARLVHARAERLRSRLASVRGCVEIGLRIAEPKSSPDAAAASGTEYMRSLQRATSTVERLHRDLAVPARESRLRRTGNVHVGAYLVPRERVDETRAVVARFAAARPELNVLCTGPWAPYSFVEEPA